MKRTIYVFLALIVAQIFQTSFAKENKIGITYITAAVPRDFPPYYSVDKNGNPTGFAIEIMDQIATRANFKVKYVIKDNWTQVDESLQNGEVDLITNIGVTDKRKEYFEFSYPLEICPISIFVLKQNTHIKTVEDLTGHKVAAVKYNVGVDLLQNRNDIELKIFYTPSEALFALLANDIDALAYPENVLKSVARSVNLENRIEVIGNPLIIVRRSIAVRKENIALLMPLNKVISAFIGTKEYQNIYERWFGKPKPYWTILRIVLFMGILLCIVLIGMVGWRYESLKSLNLQLMQNLKKLKESEKKYKELTNLLPETVFEINKVGVLIFSNQAGFSTFGYTQDDFEKGLNIFQMFIQEDQTRFKENMQRVLKGEKLGGTEYMALRKDGSMFPVIISASPIIIADEPVGLRGILIDNTEHKRIEEELKKSEENYRLIVENANEIITLAQDNLIKFVNSKTTEITGYTKEDFLSKPFIDFIHPDDKSMMMENYKKRLNGEKIPEPYSFRIIDKNGNIKWLQISAILTTWENRPATLSFLTDVTGRKKAEEDLHEKEKQFFQAQKMEAIGRLIGGIAHDFNNILTVIIGCSEYLQMKVASGGNGTHFISYIKEIKNAGEKASSLIHRLLAYSRRQILKPKVINLNQIILDTKKMLMRLIGEDIELLMNLDTDLNNAELDTSQTEQVIMNLAVNARDAMPNGGKLTIETKNFYFDDEYARNHISAKPGHYVMLSMSDNGIGMSNEVKEHLFEPFFSTKEEGKGTGLGLSTVYGIVKQSSGYIWTYSEPGIGTTFKVYYPRALKEVKIEEASKSFDKSIYGSETILIVEDEDTVRSMISSILNNFQYTVIETKNGDQAFNYINEHKNQSIDLMITDVIMPGMSGRELANKVGLTAPDIKVLYMSGYTNDAIVHHGVLEKGIPFIQKPFNINDFGRKVREVLDNK